MTKPALHHIKCEDHPLIVGRQSLASLAEILAGGAFAGAKLFILCDENTLHHCLPTLIQRVESLRSAEVIEVGAGEESKSIEVCEQLWAALAELGAERSSVIINLGGGVVSDLGGFIAGTFKRGIRFFNVPTSLLAQVDASLGSKVGIDLHGIKNQIGLFNAPEGVFVDPAFLATLPQDHLLNGFAEMLKHALICDADYWASLLEINPRHADELDASILRSIELKSEIVHSDPFEQGRRKLLNFGHTVGHALESFSLEGDSKSLAHGEAIAIGMLCEAYISRKVSGLPATDLEEISSTIRGHFPAYEIEEMHFHRIMELMSHDKKNADGGFRFSLLHSIGDASYDVPVQAKLVLESINYYRRWKGQ